MAGTVSRRVLRDKSLEWRFLRREFERYYYTGRFYISREKSIFISVGTVFRPCVYLFASNVKLSYFSVSCFNTYRIFSESNFGNT